MRKDIYDQEMKTTNPVACEEVACDRPRYHELIWSEIEALENIEFELGKLLSEIRGTPPPQLKDSDDMSPSLAAFLRDGPGVIAQYRQEAMDLIRQMREALL